jgi:hypothetical protein
MKYEEMEDTRLFSLKERCFLNVMDTDQNTNITSNDEKHNNGHNIQDSTLKSNSNFAYDGSNGLLIFFSNSTSIYDVKGDYKIDEKYLELTSNIDNNDVIFMNDIEMTDYHIENNNEIELKKNKSNKSKNIKNKNEKKYLERKKLDSVLNTKKYLNFVYTTPIVEFKFQGIKILCADLFYNNPKLNIDLDHQNFENQNKIVNHLLNSNNYNDDLKYDLIVGTLGENVNLNANYYKSLIPSLLSINNYNNQLQNKNGYTYTHDHCK